MRPSTARRTATVVTVTLVAIAAAAGVSTTIGPRIDVNLAPHPAYALSRGDPTVADVAEAVLPSVVNIASTRKVTPEQSPFHDHPFFRDFFRFRRPTPRQQRGLGSGVIISGNGVVVTNNHVVAKADKIRVTLWDNREFDAKIVGTDPKSDMAVLRLKGAKNLRPIKFGNSDKLRLGDMVLAVGNPFGVGQTVTMGIVSAKGRANMGIVDYEDFIQTDAAINPGNSGGALVNLRGELVGINTAILSRTGGYQGIGFAIPSAMVQPIMNSLLKTGKVVRGWLGVVIQQVDRDLAKAMKLPTHKGVLVADLDPKGPAKKAGLKRGDLIVRINGKKVASTGKLRNLVAAAGSGAQVTLELYRAGKKRSLSVKLAELPGQLGRSPGKGEAPGRAGGLSVAPLDSTVRNRFNIPSKVKRGVVVTGLRRDSAAARGGLRPGDVILELNRVRINSVRRFSKLYSATRGQVLLLIFRGGFSQYLLIHK